MALLSFISVRAVLYFFLLVLAAVVCSAFLLPICLIFQMFLAGLPIFIWRLIYLFFVTVISCVRSGTLVFFNFFLPTVLVLTGLLLAYLCP